VNVAKNFGWAFGVYNDGLLLDYRESLVSQLSDLLAREWEIRFWG